MIILIQDREDNLHLVDFTNRGRHWTLCGLIYNTKNIINTLGLDNTVHNICKTCQANHEKYYGYNVGARQYASASQNRFLSKNMSLTKARAVTDKYWYLVDRYSEQIASYKRKLARK